MASCPNCGFDLAPDGGCPVCGYGRGAGSQKGSATKVAAGAAARGPQGAAGAAGASRSRILLIAGIVVVLVLAAVGAIVIAERASGGQSAATTAQAAATAGAAVSQPTVQPAAAAPENPAVTGAAAAPASAPAIAASDQPTGGSGSYDSAKFEDNPYFHVAVGASPLAVRAAKPIDLYDPAHQPVYNIDNLAYPPLSSEDAYVAWMKKRYPSETEHFLRWRWQRAAIALERHRMTHQRVLEAFLLTPREWFVRSFNLNQTYSNTAIPIGFGQTISGPDLVSNMTNALDPQPNQRVLEIGTGSGYQSAFLSSLSNYVYTIEIVRPLAEQTNEIYLEHTAQLPQLGNIHRRAADGYYGWPKYAPFDRIIVTTGIDHIPPILLQELKPGGIMVIPVGPPTGQVVLKITKTVGPNGDIHITREDIYHGTRKEIFVPFTAATGGTHNTSSSR